MGRALVPLTYAELVALTDDIPAGPERSRPGGTGQGMVRLRESNAAKQAGPVGDRRSRICVGGHVWRAIRSRLCRKGLAPSRREKPARHAVTTSDRPSWGWAFSWPAG